MKYFVIAISLLKRFDKVIFEHVPRIENQEANDLTQIASGYKISSEKLEELIEIKDKLIIDQPPSMELSMPKLVGADVPQDNGQDTIYDGDENSEIGKGEYLQNCHFSLSYSTCSRNWHF
ncbi:hypothetical protein QL285_024341 [Trifolium repens]|nr:hypothetical protein QL285_024341 [Trifolium repens]